MKFQPILKDYTKQSDYHPVDLSAKTLKSYFVNPSNHSSLNLYFKSIRDESGADVLYGGYLEKRSLYEEKSLFNDNKQKRNIHLGVDFWAKSGKEITAPLDGEVHSFKDNQGFGNYGPCIILKHDSDEGELYTLYGHLSKASLKNLKIGQPIKKNQVFCDLGEPTENGGYLPHLHFQIIKNIQKHDGDYPGVCSQSDLQFYKADTLDPILFLAF
jgi:murein DD-endopeptidase MepM/ murein hydrolase activator NlpD